MCSDRHTDIAAFEKKVRSALWKERSSGVEEAKLYRAQHGPDRGEPYVLEKNSSLPRPEWIMKGTSSHYEIALLAGEATALWAFDNGFTQEEVGLWWGTCVRSPCTVRDGWPWSAKARWAEAKARANRRAEEEARWRHKYGVEPLGKTLARKEAIRKQNAQQHRQRRLSMVDAIMGTT